jgi:hypothetical protein
MAKVSDGGQQWAIMNARAAPVPRRAARVFS